MEGMRCLQQMAGDAARRRAAGTALPRRRRRKMAVARLGGGGGRPWRRFVLGRALRRMRLRWLAALYRRALHRVRAACASAAAQSVLEAAATVGAARLDAGV